MAAIALCGIDWGQPEPNSIAAANKGGRYHKSTGRQRQRRHGGAQVLDEHCA